MSIATTFARGGGSVGATSSKLRGATQEGRGTGARTRLVRERAWTWLMLHEVGLPMSTASRPSPWPVERIAKLFGVSLRTVQLGLASARRLREAVRDVAMDH